MKRIICSLLLAAACAVLMIPPVQAQAQAPSAAAARVDDYLTRLVPYGFSGAVLIATAGPDGSWSSGGRIVLKKAYGMADREAKLPYSVDMVSCIGSVTKQFTGAAIVKLQEMGKLSVQDPIAKYLPGVPADKQGITIHHLLTHTAGLSGDLGGGDEIPIPRDELVAKVLAAPLGSPVGSRFEYSNEGFALAGAIVERVSGMGYEAFLREQLLLPAGMKDTGYLAPAWPLSRLPIGYAPNGEPWGRVYKNEWLPDGPGWYLRANGGIQSSLDDLYRWHLALENGTVLSPASMKLYQTGHVPVGESKERYAYGWGVLPTRRGTTAITHNGGNGFFFSDFRRYVDEKVVIIAMSNQPVIPATQLAGRQIEALYFNDAAVVMPPVGVSVPKASRDGLAGKYTVNPTSGTAPTNLTVTSSDTGLMVKVDDPSVLGTLGSITPAGGRFAELEARTQPIVAALSKGNVEPFVQAMQFEMTERAEMARTNQARMWREWRQEFGGGTEQIEVLGTGNVQGDPAVTVRVRFESGSVVLQFMWGPRRLAGFRVVPSEPVALVAESPTRWVYYSYRLPQLVTFTFDGNGGVQVEAPTGRFTAGRVSPGAPAAVRPPMMR